MCYLTVLDLRLRDFELHSAKQTIYIFGKAFVFKEPFGQKDFDANRLTSATLHICEFPTVIPSF